MLAVATLGLVGDYNQNGTVDAADYIVWRDTQGETGMDLAADRNGDGLINQADYDAWRARFGNMAGSGAAARVAAVPEPATSICLLPVVFFVILCQSRGPRAGMPRCLPALQRLIIGVV